MDLSAALTVGIRELTLGVGHEGAIADSVAVLDRDLKLAIRSYLGLRLVLFDRHPITLTAFASGVRREDIMTSMLVPLSRVTDEFSFISPGNTITFYAGAGGAFADFAADLTYALGLTGHLRRPAPFPRLSGQLSAVIAIDNDLSPSTVSSGLTGTEELAVINRAVGMLIGNGHDPDDAHHELSSRAAMAGLTRADWASQLVRPGRDLGLATTAG